ncbi:MAG: glycine--tRNA ligase subunit beta [Chloroflexota bacterium]
MSETLSFDGIILRLLEFWKEQGCLVWQPYNVQVGAGTMNPATVLRVLGPEPWNIAYIEPSIRPDDGRFAENPNRMQQHYQLQVILKPEPGNPQELLIESYKAIGIDPRQHDIRFVEDNWAQPALGAWGLGWEVWLDGQEITQFTYFQQVGGIELDPVPVELTYGLDRIALALQGKNSVWEMDYGAGIGYGDALMRSEWEHSEYYFNTANVESLRTIYDLYEKEAYNCLEAGLVIPAHDYNLKCSHLFNVMDTRGAIGVTERAGFFRRMRTVAYRVSEAYIEQRQRMEFPLLDNENWQTAVPELVIAKPTQTAAPDAPQTFVLEIGVEELPADVVDDTIAQLEKSVPALLKDLRLDYGSIEVHGTPRRLAVLVHELAGQQPDLETVAKGPPANRAFDHDGEPTKAAIGFARSKGVDVGSLKVVEEKGRSYVTAVLRENGRLATEVLADALADFVGNIKFGKSMRWNHTNIAFNRPLRWLVALFGGDVIPFAYAGVLSGRISRGLRPYDSPDIEISDADSYVNTIADNDIVLKVAERRDQIVAGAKVLADEKGGTIPNDPGLLAEVTNLVERPVPFRGEFEAKYLRLPAPVLVGVMRKHQRYFPIYDGDGNLLPYFIAVRNGDGQHLDIVTDGNEQVIRARFADADFFYRRDTQHKLEAFVPKLDKLTFESKLGSMLDKTQRLEKLVPTIAGMIGLDEAETAVSSRAASLAKADLATQMVVEMTSLQGIIGGHYAKLSGESDAVAQVISEQYGSVSSSNASLAFALADRLDSLTGLFAAGLAPKGSNDPFAMRRAAIQIIENLIGNETGFDVQAGLEAAASLQPIDCGDDVISKVQGFINGRLGVVLREQGHRASVVKAVLAEQSNDPAMASKTAVRLSAAIQVADWDDLLNAYARCVRITRKLDNQLELRPADFALAEEQNLAAAYATAAAASDGTVDTFVSVLRGMVPAINAFFDEVLVMAEETAVRENRLALLQHIANLTQGIADLSELEGF